MTFLYNCHIIDYEYIFSRHPQTILFLHGWGGNKDSFIKLKRILKPNYNIISLTLPPSSDSVTSLTMYDYKNIVVNLLTCLGINQVIIICHSFGFRVSLMLATSNITIKKIIITGGAGIILKANIFKQMSNNFRKIFLKHNPQYFNKYASPDYKYLSAVNQKTFKNIVNKDLTNYIKLLNCPMLLFWGTHDTATPIKMFKIIKKLQPQAKQIIIKNGTHFCYLEQGELFANACQNFLNG